MKTKKQIKIVFDTFAANLFYLLLLEVQERDQTLIIKDEAVKHDKT